MYILQKVSLVKALEVEEAVRKSIELLGGMQLEKGKIAVIKPNICNSKNPYGMVITDFRIIKAVVDIVRENGSEVLIVESDNVSDYAENRIEKSGLSKLLDKWDVDFLNLSDDDYKEYKVANTLLRLPKTVLEADYFINLPKIKTCAHTLVTLSIKNLYGVFQRKQKGRLHKHLNEILPFLSKTIKNDLIVVDGINCMEGNGPVIGSPLCLNLIVAGHNLVSVDSICSRLMGYNPNNISHIALSANEGVGPIDMEHISIIGEKLPSYDFEPPYSLKANLKSLKAFREIYLK